MTAPQGAGGAGPEIWLDMSRYPDTDPDSALTGEEQDLLRSSLAVDDLELPDAVWEHMLAVVTGSDEADGAEGTDGTDGTDPGADDAAGWDADPAPDVHADHDPALGPALGPALDPALDPADDPAGHDDGAWDGGAV